MKITKRWLEGEGACHDGIAWFVAQTETDGGAIVRKLMAEYPQNKKGLDWVNWLIVRILNRKQKIQYAIFAAEQVIDLFEAEYPDDKRPREALEAARAVSKRDTAKNRAAADAAAYAAIHAARAARVAAYAAEAASAAAAAVYAASEAAYAAVYAAYAVYATSAVSAVSAADAAADAASDAADAVYTVYTAYAVYATSATSVMRTKILKYGLTLIEEDVI